MTESSTIINLPQLVLVKILKCVLYTRSELLPNLSFHDKVIRDKQSSRQNFLNLLLTNKRFHTVFQRCRHRILKHFLWFEHRLLQARQFNTHLDLRGMPEKFLNCFLQTTAQVHPDATTVDVTKLTFRISKQSDYTPYITLESKTGFADIKTVELLAGGQSMHKWTDIGRFKGTKTLDVRLANILCVWHSIQMVIVFNGESNADFQLHEHHTYFPRKIRDTLLVGHCCVLTEYVRYTKGFAVHPGDNTPCQALADN